MNQAGVLRIVILSLVLCAASLSPLSTAQTSSAEASKPVFSANDIEVLVAPIALYPDSVVSQVLIASTYPLEIVSANRWVKANEKLKGDSLAKELEKQSWDPSVKSLVNFPQVLEMMDGKLDWTQQLGDAVLAQQGDVMTAVQRLRKKAKDQGNLTTTEQQTVVVEKTVIKIVPAQPEVVYVPVYNPTVVYGALPPSPYVPYYYRPYGYVPGAAAFGFAAGVAVGAAWGYAWGGCNWYGGRHGHGDIDIDINRNVNIDNKRIDRNKYSNRQGGGKGSWKHNPTHRKGVKYRDGGTAKKYNRGRSAQQSKARESYRGRSNKSGLSGTNRSGVNQRNSGANRNRPNTTNRPNTGSKRKSSSRSKGKSSAFGGKGSRNSTKRASSRGSKSRSSDSRSRSGGSRGGRSGGRRR